MSQTTNIYSSRCWIEGKLQPATISMAEGKITSIILLKAENAADFGDAVIMPAVIDAHVHVNEPGRTDWEGFDTATQAAAAAGTGTIIDMPLNASPVTTNIDAFKQKLEASKDKLHINVGFYGGLIPGNINDLDALMNEGVIGIKCFLTHSGIDEFPDVSEKDLEEAMPLIAKHKIPLLAHCEIADTTHETDLHLHPQSYQHYLASRPAKWENDAVNLMIKLCKKHQCKTHIVHVSSAEALASIEEAKASGYPLTAETCPHYIYFNAENIPDTNTLFKCAPPIRGKDNNALLKSALVSGVLDFIATDHSPAPATLKEMDSGNLQKAWGGIAGLQFLLSSAFTAMKETISLEKFIPLLTEHPAIFLNIEYQKGFLKTGFDADIVIWTPEEKFMVKEEDILHRHKMSPFVGEELYGNVLQTIVNGITVYSNKKIINKNAGKWLLKK